MIAGVGRNGRIVHLFWVHFERYVDRLNVGREKNGSQGGHQRPDNWERDFQRLGWIKVWEDQVWGNVLDLLCWRCLRHLRRDVGRQTWV